MQSGTREQVIPIELDGFEGRGLSYRLSVWRGRLLLDGQRVSGRRGRYTLRNNHGKEVRLRVRHNGIDPIPKLDVEGRIIHLAPPLKWYEYVWAGVPLLLLHVGGALGGGIGAAALYANVRVFRSDRSPLAKYVRTAATTVVAALAYVVAAVAIVLLIRLVRHGR